MSAKQLSWTAPYASCTTTYRVLDHDGLNWTLKVNPGASCKSISIVTIRKTDPHAPDSFWNIAGYKDAADLSKRPDQASLSCLMY